MSSIDGFKSAFTQIKNTKVNLDSENLAKFAATNRNLFHRTIRSIKELCLVIRAKFDNSIKIDKDHIQNSYNKDAGKIISYLNREINHRILPQTLPNKKELEKQSQQVIRNAYNGGNEESYMTPIYLEKSPYDTSSIILDKKDTPYSILDKNFKLFLKHKENLKKPDGYLVHTFEGVYLLDSNFSYDENSLVNPKENLNELKNYLTGIVSINPKEKQADYVSQATANLKKLDRVFHDTEAKQITFRSDEHEFTFEKSGNTVKIITSKISDHDIEPQMYYIPCKNQEISIGQFKQIIQFSLLNAIKSGSEQNIEYLENNFLCFNDDYKSDMIQVANNILEKNKFGGCKVELMFAKIKSSDLKPWKKLSSILSSYFLKSSKESHLKACRELIANFHIDILKNEDNWINFIGGFKTKLMNITDDNLENPTTIDSAQNLWSTINNHVTLERNVARKTTTFTDLRKKLEGDDKVSSFTKAQKILFYHALDQLDNISIYAFKLIPDYDLIELLYKNGINEISNNIRGSEEIRKKCINQAYTLMSKDPLYSSQPLTDKEIQDVRNVFINTNYKW